MFKVHTALFVVSAAAVLACAGLFVPVLADTGPERAEPVAAGARPSPTTTAPSTREGPGQQHCLIGSWQVVTEQLMFKFYTDVDPLPFTSTGGLRYYEFRPDGTAIERNVNFTMVGSYRGNELRYVRNGERTFTWSATDKTITYHTLPATSLVSDYYDQRGRLDPGTELPNPNFNETDDIACSPTQTIESTTRESRYSAMWTRTADYGVYG
ncbi:lipocalin family protein [Actinophytocola sp.]|uniref:lipocalin family protein n=1 Tax=Actinophytocola sp. TaxID=1872138 RepID=UPI002ED55457